jgi:hypothetical protein
MALHRIVGFALTSRAGDYDDPSGGVHVEGDRVIEEGRPLRPDELIPKGNGASAASSSPGIEPKGQNHLLSFDWFKKEEYGTFTGEPPRASLTDPPPGYQTPSPDQPYGIPPDRKPAKASTLGERMERYSDNVCRIACAQVIDGRGGAINQCQGDNEGS